MCIAALFTQAKKWEQHNIYEFHNEETDMAYLYSGILSGNKERSAGYM